MTEAEARERWCPFARPVIWQGEAPTGAEAYAQTRCLAADCMAWVWQPDHQLTLGNGMIVLLDAADANWAETLGCWWDGRYPRAKAGRLHVLLYERLYGPPQDGMMVDHSDGDPLNCRRRNIRTATPIQNAANAASRGGASRYRGVSAHGERWIAQISRDGVREHLGTFDSELGAAGAYDAAAIRVHGEFARLNLSPKQNSGRQGYCGLAGDPFKT
jgi:hypothetical protein